MKIPNINFNIFGVPLLTYIEVLWMFIMFILASLYYRDNVSGLYGLIISLVIAALGGYLSAQRIVYYLRTKRQDEIERLLLRSLNIGQEVIAILSDINEDAFDVIRDKNKIIKKYEKLNKKS